MDGIRLDVLPLPGLASHSRRVILSPGSVGLIAEAHPGGIGEAATAIAVTPLLVALSMAPPAPQPVHGRAPGRG